MSSESVLCRRSCRWRWALECGAGHRRHLPYRVLRMPHLRVVLGARQSEDWRPALLRCGPMVTLSLPTLLPQTGNMPSTFLSPQCPAQSPARGSGTVCGGENQIIGSSRGQDVGSSLTSQWSPSCLAMWGKYRDPPS